MINQIEPTYLRYIYDGLAKGTIHPDNASALPEGLIGLYEEAFDENTPVTERQKSLQRFTVWALLKKEVSANFVAEVLGEKEEDILNFIATYSKWFNSPESGKFQLYHERLRVFLLQKLSKKETQILQTKLITQLTNAIERKKGEELEIYALEYLSKHLFLNNFEDYSEYFDFISDNKLAERQIEISKEYQWSRNNILEGIKLSALKNDDFNLTKCLVHYKELLNKETKSLDEIFRLLLTGNYRLAINRCDNLESKLKLKLLLIILHELLIGNCRNEPYRSDACENILMSIKQIPDHIHWSEFYSEQLLYDYSLALMDLKLDSTTLWRKSKSTFYYINNNSKFNHELLLDIINYKKDELEKLQAFIRFTQLCFYSGNIAKCKTHAEKCIKLIESILLPQPWDSRDNIWKELAKVYIMLSDTERLNEILNKLEKDYVLGDLVTFSIQEGKHDFAIHLLNKKNPRSSIPDFLLLGIQHYLKLREISHAVQLSQFAETRMQKAEYLMNIGSQIKKGELLDDIINEIKIIIENTTDLPDKIDLITNFCFSLLDYNSNFYQHYFKTLIKLIDNSSYLRSGYKQFELSVKLKTLDKTDDLNILFNSISNNFKNLNLENKERIKELSFECLALSIPITSVDSSIARMKIEVFDDDLIRHPNADDLFYYCKNVYDLDGLIKVSETFFTDIKIKDNISNYISEPKNLNNKDYYNFIIPKLLDVVLDYLELNKLQEAMFINNYCLERIINNYSNQASNLDVLYKIHRINSDLISEDIIISILKTSDLNVQYFISSMYDFIVLKEKVSLKDLYKIGKVNNNKVDCSEYEGVTKTGRNKVYNIEIERGFYALISKYVFNYGFKLRAFEIASNIKDEHVKSKAICDLIILSAENNFNVDYSLEIEKISILALKSFCYSKLANFRNGIYLDIDSLQKRSFELFRNIPDEYYKVIILEELAKNDNEFINMQNYKSFDLLLNSEYYLKQLSTKLLFLIVSKNKHFIKKDIKILVDSEIKDTDEYNIDYSSEREYFVGKLKKEGQIEKLNYYIELIKKKLYWTFSIEKRFNLTIKLIEIYYEIKEFSNLVHFAVRLDDNWKDQYLSQAAIEFYKMNNIIEFQKIQSKIKDNFYKKYLKAEIFKFNNILNKERKLNESWFNQFITLYDKNEINDWSYEIVNESEKSLSYQMTDFISNYLPDSDPICEHMLLGLSDKLLTEPTSNDYFRLFCFRYCHKIEFIDMLLFYRARNICFFNEKINLNHISLLEQVIDLTEWKKIISLK